jgi:hypothetical protein
MNALAPKLRDRAQRLLSDFPYFAEHCLKIRPKAGGLIPLELNRIQESVHGLLERQRRETGRVRAMILKARQPGVSTYVEARFFHWVTQRHGIQAYILTHAQQATDNLFGMAERFHQNLPEPLALTTERANAKELRFAGLDSGIMVSTAGAKGAGRAQTIQLFHGSEVAHWTDARDHMAGVLQAVPDADGTEVILESTANGLGGLFCDMCRAAERGEGEYILIFIPWHWAEEYEAKPPEGWRPPEAFAAYGAAHELTPEQVYWAYRKNGELARACNAPSDEICWLFRQEYPATSAEAFRASGHESYVPAEYVLAARRFEAPDQSAAPLILGIDIARGGGDKTRIISRRGRIAGDECNVTIDTRDLMDVTGRVAMEIDRTNPDRVFLDGTGLGAGVYDRLAERGYTVVELVNFGSKAAEAERYVNKRAEMWARMAEWMRDAGGADIPDDDAWQSAICAPGYQFDSNSRLQLEAKEKIKSRVGFSPDVGDGLALTFAETVHPMPDMRKLKPLRNRERQPHGWMGA